MAYVFQTIAYNLPFYAHVQIKSNKITHISHSFDDRTLNINDDQTDAWVVNYGCTFMKRRKTFFFIQCYIHVQFIKIKIYFQKINQPLIFHTNFDILIIIWKKSFDGAYQNYSSKLFLHIPLCS